MTVIKMPQKKQFKGFKEGDKVWIWEAAVCEYVVVFDEYGQMLVRPSHQIDNFGAVLISYPDKLKTTREESLAELKLEVSRIK